MKNPAARTYRPSGGMNRDFSRVPVPQRPRSAFRQDYSHTTAFDSGLLVPIHVAEHLPGDTVSIRPTLLARPNAFLKPLMTQMYLDTFWFAVPYRLVWDNFEKFFGEQVNPGDSTDFEVPQVNIPDASGGWAEQSLGDYMGIPPGIDDFSHNALFTRAFLLIWNEWFRDENLQDSLTVPTDDGPDAIADYIDFGPDNDLLPRRGKRHDYFTSCLPWPQKGGAAEVPLAGLTPTTAPTTIVGAGDPSFVVNGVTGLTLGSAASPNTNVQWSSAPNTDASATWDSPNLSGTTDLSGVTTAAVTVNELRQAIAIQHLLERDARSGTRYPELVRSRFGVEPLDGRLQRPEFLHSTSQPMLVNVVPNTTTLGTQAQLASWGVLGGPNRGFVKSFSEHCVLIGIASVRADLLYQQGLHRMWSRLTRYEHYDPDLAFLGEQAVLNKELYLQGVPGEGAAQDDGVFGYQSRWEEYRTTHNRVSGRIRSSAAQSLDIWTLAQDFSSLPVLDSKFIQEDPPTDRITAVPGEPDFTVDCYFQQTIARVMPMHSTPGLRRL